MVRTCRRFQPGFFVRGKTFQCLIRRMMVVPEDEALFLLTQPLQGFSTRESHLLKRLVVLPDDANLKAFPAGLLSTAKPFSVCFERIFFVSEDEALPFNSTHSMVFPPPNPAP